MNFLFTFIYSFYAGKIFFAVKHVEQAEIFFKSPLVSANLAVSAVSYGTPVIYWSLSVQIKKLPCQMTGES